NYLPGSLARFSLPCIHFQDALAQPTLVSVLAEEGITLHAADLKGLKPVPTKDVSGRVLSYSADRPPYGGTFRIDRAKTAPSVRSGPLVESKEGKPSRPDNEGKTELSKLLLDEQGVAVLDGQSWLHKATYWLYQGAGADLGVSLPQGSK